MKKLIRIITGAALLLMLSVHAHAYTNVNVYLDGGKITFDVPPIHMDGTVMVPMRSIFEAHGAVVYWDGAEQEVYAKHGSTEIYLKIGVNTMDINGETIELNMAPFVSMNRTYVPVRAISEAFGSTVSWDQNTGTVSIATPVEYNEILNDVVITDEFRYNNYDGQYNAVHVFDNGRQYFGMELIGIRPWQGEEYADIVNGMAKDLPDVRVFCGVVPTAAEFYAAKPFKTNYLSSIAHIYNKLDEKVIPLNIEGAMSMNAGQYLYFRTDHHWTHLGAYCAYLEFCNRAGLTPASLDSFNAVGYEDYLGSWGKVSMNSLGYFYLNMSKDRIVIYEPNMSYSGMSYNDMAMKKPIKEMVLINNNFPDYNKFIEGDYPIDHFHTNANTGKSICVIKDSYGNAFTTWLVNNYDDIYVVDYRCFNSSIPSERFTVKEFYEMHPFDDLLMLSYPYTIAADDLRQKIGEMWRYQYKNPEHVTEYVPDFTMVYYFGN